MRGGATELERSLGCNGLDVGDATNAVRSKNLSVVAHPANSTSRCDIRKPETVVMTKSPAPACLFCPFFCRARLLPHIPALRIHFVEFTVQSAAADSQLSGRSSNISARRSQRLGDEPFFCFCQV